MTPELIAGWETVLSDIPPDAIDAAITRCLCERVYTNLPAPGEVRRMAIDWMAGETINSDQAFDVMLKAVRCWGRDRKDRAEQEVGPSIWETIQRLGGWAACCDFPSDQRNTFRAQFRDAWNKFNDQVRTRLRLPVGVAPKVVQPHEAVENLARWMGVTPDKPSP